jgi:hypothetical protein
VEASLSLAAEYIYFKPVINSFYAIPNSTPEGVSPLQGPRLAAEYDFSSGYRLSGAYRFFCDRASVLFRWSSLHTSHDHSVSDLFVEPVNVTDIVPALTNVTAHDTINFDYNSFDALLGWRIYQNTVLTSLYLGVHYIKTSNTQNDQYSGFSSLILPAVYTVTWSTEVQGIGPELAISAQYRLPKIRCLPGIELLGSMQIGALVIENGKENKISTNFHRLGTDLPTSISNEEIQKIVPFWDLRLGLGSSTCVGLFTMNLSLGYEILSYYNLFNRTVFLRIGSPTFDFYKDLYLHGLFIRLAVGY